MRYKIFKDNDNYLTGFEHTGTEQDTFVLEPTTMKLDYLNCYKVLETKVEFDEEKYQSIQAMNNIKEEVARLKEELNSTDYKIIKCSEYQIAGLELPYDIVKLHQERQELRDKINELEN